MKKRERQNRKEQGEANSRDGERGKKGSDKLVKRQGEIKRKQAGRRNKINEAGRGNV